MPDPANSGFKITMMPHLRVRDAARAIEWYKRAFGALETERLTAPDGVVVHAEMTIGGARFSLGEEAPDSPGPQTLGGSPVGIDLIVADVDALAQQAVAAGAKVVYPIKDQFYGMRQGRLVDPFGHVWMIGSPLEDLSPAEMQRRFDELVKSGQEG